MDAGSGASSVPSSGRSQPAPVSSWIRQPQSQHPQLQRRALYSNPLDVFRRHFGSSSDGLGYDLGNSAASSLPSTEPLQGSRQVGGGENEFRVVSSTGIGQQPGNGASPGGFPAHSYGFPAAASSSSYPGPSRHHLSGFNAPSSSAALFHAMRMGLSNMLWPSAPPGAAPAAANSQGHMGAGPPLPRMDPRGAAAAGAPARPPRNPSQDLSSLEESLMSSKPIPSMERWRDVYLGFSEQDEGNEPGPAGGSGAKKGFSPPAPLAFQRPAELIDLTDSEPAVPGEPGLPMASSSLPPLPPSSGGSAVGMKQRSGSADAMGNSAAAGSSSAASRKPIYASDLRIRNSRGPGGIPSQWKADLRIRVREFVPGARPRPDGIPIDEIMRKAKLPIELYPHQRFGVWYMLTREFECYHGGFLADDMGLGKTVQMLCLHKAARALRKLCRLAPTGPTLVVCPVAVIQHWAKEATKLAGIPSTDVTILHGATGYTPKGEVSASQVVITTYGTVQSRYKSLLKFKDPHTGSMTAVEREAKKDNIFGINYGRIVLDESHNAKNSSTNTHISLRRLCEDASRTIWLLSGTPLNNSVLDILAQCKLVGVSPYNERKFWKIAKDNAKERSAWRNRFVLRRTKTLVLADSLAEKTIEVVVVPMEPNEKAVYGRLSMAACYVTTLWEHLKEEKDKKAIVARMYVLAAIQRLLLATLHPLLLRGYFESNPFASPASCEAERKRVSRPKKRRAQAKDDEKDEFMRTSNRGKRDYVDDLDDFLEQDYGGNSSGDEGSEESPNQSKKQKPKFAPLSETEESDSKCCRVCAQNQDDLVTLPCKHYICRKCMAVHLRAALPHDTEGFITESLVQAWEDEAGESVGGMLDKLSDRMQQLTSRLFGIQRNPAPKAEKVEGAPGGDEYGDGVLPVPIRCQMCCWTSSWEKAFELPLASSRVKSIVARVQEALERDASAKIVMFSKFRSFLDIIQTYLYQRGLSTLRYDGTMNTTERADTVQAFSESSEARILLVSITAGGVGLNLTAATEAWILDHHFNPAVELQAIDRVHRIGQSRSVKVLAFHCPGTADDWLCQMQLQKREAMDRIVDGVGDDAGEDARLGLTDEDLRQFNHFTEAWAYNYFIAPSLQQDSAAGSAEHPSTSVKPDPGRGSPGSGAASGSSRQGVSDKVTHHPPSVSNLLPEHGLLLPQLRAPLVRWTWSEVARARAALGHQRKLLRLNHTAPRHAAYPSDDSLVLSGSEDDDDDDDILEVKDIVHAQGATEESSGGTGSSSSFVASAASSPFSMPAASGGHHGGGAMHSVDPSRFSSVSASRQRHPSPPNFSSPPSSGVGGTPSAPAASGFLPLWNFHQKSPPLEESPRVHAEAKLRFPDPSQGLSTNGSRHRGFPPLPMGGVSDPWSSSFSSQQASKRQRVGKSEGASAEPPARL